MSLEAQFHREQTLKFLLKTHKYTRRNRSSNSRYPLLQQLTQNSLSQNSHVNFLIMDFLPHPFPHDKCQNEAHLPIPLSNVILKAYPYPIHLQLPNSLSNLILLKDQKRRPSKH